ncbi:MAG: hypothetical protein IAE82_10330 [Opitutaceae bacterium]|nr:hypothetical protein [Opitutaceae bacterium]
MTSRPAAITLGLVVACIVVGVLGNAARNRREAVVSIAERAAHLTALTERRDAALRRLVALRDSSPKPSGRSVDDSTTGKSSAAVPVVPKPPSYPSRSIAEEPILQVLKQEADRGLHHLRYASFVRSLALTEHQAEALYRLVQDHDTRRLDLNRSIQNQKLNINDPAAVALRNEAEHAREADLRALLGEAGLAQLTTYERTVSLRQTVANYSVAATMAGEPLKASQTEEMIRILAESTSLYRAGGSAKDGAVDWEEALPRMQALLSPSQFAHISQIEPTALGGSASRFMITFLSAAQSAAREADPTTVRP